MRLSVPASIKGVIRLDWVENHPPRDQISIESH